MNVILTEKPSVARDFAKALNCKSFSTYYKSSDYVIVWALGHLFELMKPDDYDKKYIKWKLNDLPIFPKFKYSKKTSKIKHINTLENIISEYTIDKFIVATDAGREGELIGRIIISELKIKAKNFFRFYVSEALTVNVINLNINNNLKPLSNFDNLYKNALYRSMADWLIGINLTRFLSINKGQLYSVGRVQSCILGIIFDRYKENSEFKFNYIYFIDIYIDNNIKLTSDKITNENDANNILNKLSNISSLSLNFDITEKYENVLLYNLSDLQSDAYKFYKFSGKKTLQIAQSLYDTKKIISYPRTDSKYLGDSSKDNIENYLNLFPDFNNLIDWTSIDNHRIFNNEKLSDHHAIIPLNIAPNNLTSDEKNIFNLILYKFISCFSRPFHYENQKIYFNFNDLCFSSNSIKIIDLSWKILYNNSNKSNNLILVNWIKKI